MAIFKRAMREQLSTQCYQRVWLQLALFTYLLETSAFPEHEEMPRPCFSIRTIKQLQNLAVEREPTNYSVGIDARGTDLPTLNPEVTMHTCHTILKSLGYTSRNKLDLRIFLCSPP